MTVWVAETCIRCGVGDADWMGAATMAVLYSRSFVGRDATGCQFRK